MRESDVAMARDLATDPYVPEIGSLPAGADDDEALAWVHRQRGRHAEGTGFSFTIADAATDAAVGHCGLWLKELADGRGTAGYAIAPSERGRGLAADALAALTSFGWTVPGLFRIALYIEPWNVGSVRTAERAGYGREGLLRSHQPIAGERRDMLLYASVRPG
ncbi:Protein N-acetyltransferase, RimJ/RimL family [Jiangella sp. DSM 45060]|nr:Protein N-acetyltransferase, RimJ/RimL family [Jiangella sp. DSM 45060]